MKKNLITRFLLLTLLFGFFSCVERDDDTIPKEGYYQIPAMSLAGWDEGVCYFSGNSAFCDNYIVSVRDSVDGSVTVCLNTGGNGKTVSPVVAHLASNADVLKVIAAGHQFCGVSNDKEVEFTAYDADGKICGHFTVPYLPIEATASTRSPFIDDNGEPAISKMMDFETFADEVFKVTDVLFNLGIITDYLLGELVGETLPILKDNLITAKAVKEQLCASYESEMTRFMGNANIEICSVTQTSDSTVSVRACISKRSFIPPLRTIVNEGGVAQVSNQVMYGIAIGSKASANLLINKGCTDMFPVSTEDTITMTFDITTQIGKGCYFRPFLIPEHCLDDSGKPSSEGYNYAKYGTAGRYVDLGIEFSKYKHIRCGNSESGSGNVAEFSIDAKIPYLFDNMENWGIIVETPTGNYAMPYYAKEDSWATNIPTEKNFKCKLHLVQADIIDQGAERICNFTITPFVEFKNTQPPIARFVDQEATYLVKAMTCSATEHPHAVDLGLSVRWACCNVGATHPKGDCEFYAWGEVDKKGSNTEANYKYVKDLDGDDDYFDDDDNWIHIGTNISGTSYDVAHVKWRDGWRMPTASEFEELYNECTWEWAPYGMRGYQVTGPNGRSIFLPAEGYRYEAMIYRPQENPSSYWTGTLSKEEGQKCYAYKFSFFGTTGHGVSWDYRHYGYPIRPVKDYEKQ